MFYTCKSIGQFLYPYVHCNKTESMENKQELYQTLTTHNNSHYPLLHPEDFITV